MPRQGDRGELDHPQQRRALKIPSLEKTNRYKGTNTESQKHMNQHPDSYIFLTTQAPQNPKQMSEFQFFTPFRT